MASKVEVRITYCCCCSLTVATILIAIYTIVMYGVFLGLAAVSINRITTGKPDPALDYTAAATIKVDEHTVVQIDPYFYSLGLYTEHMLFTTRAVRLPVLCISIAIFILLIISAILMLISVCTLMYWLLVPWLAMMTLDVIRGTILCILIFVWSDGDIRKIAVGIFFLGLQLFHMSLMLIIFAKFQRMQNKEKGIEYRIEKTGDKSILIEGSNSAYPTMPSQYAYSASPHYRRDVGYYQPPGPGGPLPVAAAPYNTYGGERRPGPGDAVDGRAQQQQYYRTQEARPTGTASLPRTYPAGYGPNM